MDFDTDNEYARSRGMQKRRDGEGEEEPAKSVEGWILFVAGVHEEATEEELLSLFDEYGEVKNINLPLDRCTCYVKGYALIEYADLESAKQAMRAVDGNELNDQILRVSWAFLKGPIRDR
eukprot:TRINITY_DN8066_c0_g1_i5.p1 TRINITY_DN8066_c0_g1~~TRINITY_DN8066_c0_g1_i5.p1  ORF type:complete len:120 (+),score=21.22 TRINITY_DN8066_c0_g1_i5:45-404(+)